MTSEELRRQIGELSFQLRQTEQEEIDAAISALISCADESLSGLAKEQTGKVIESLIKHLAERLERSGYLDPQEKLRSLVNCITSN